MTPTDNNDKDSVPVEATKITPILIRAIIISCLGGILVGYDLGVISGALPSLRSSLDLTSTESEAVISCLYVGSIIGAFTGGTVCDAFGRRTAILLTDVTFTLAATLLASASDFNLVLLGRIIAGIAVSVSEIAGVSYLTELAPEDHRGAIVACHEGSVSLGFLLAFMSSYFITVTKEMEDGWRLMFSLTAVIAFGQFVGMCSMPESPTWLMKRGRDMDARAAWARLHGERLRDVLPGADLFAPVVDSDDEREYDESKRKLEMTSRKNNKEEEERSHGREDEATPEREAFNDDQSVEEAIGLGKRDTKRAIGTPATLRGCLPASDVNILSYWRQFIIATFLAISEHFCGHVNVINFAPEIFENVFYHGGGSDIGEDEDQDEYTTDEMRTMLAPTLLLGSIKFLVTCIFIIQVDECGRRKLLLTGIGMIAISMLLLVIVFSQGFRFRSAETDGGQADDEHSHSTAQLVLAMLGCIGVVTGYALSFGPLVWLITSELFPANVRGRALGWTNTLSSASAVLVTFTFLSGQDAFGPAVPFILYFVVSILSWSFAFISVPETAHVEADEHPAELEGKLNEMWLWRQNCSCRYCFRRCCYCCCRYCFGLRETSAEPTPTSEPGSMKENSITTEML